MRNRRQTIALLGGAAVWPLTAWAQQPSGMRLIGVLTTYSRTDREGQARLAGFVEGLQRLGWVDGRNARIEYRWGAVDAEHTKVAASSLVRASPTVIVVASNPALAELRRFTTTIPVVFTQVSDPIGNGFVANMARPGGNITGFENFEPSMGGRWLGLLKEAVPGMRRAAVLFGSDVTSNVAYVRAAEAIGPSMGVEITNIDVLGGVELERAIASFADKPDGGLIVVPHPYIAANRASIIILATRHRLPAVYPFRYVAAEGGLMSYGIDQVEQWRGAARYVDRILRGEKPGDLPVQAPTKFELVVNMKTAKALGINIPPAFPLRADEVIE